MNILTKIATRTCRYGIQSMLAKASLPKLAYSPNMLFSNIKVLQTTSKFFFTEKKNGNGEQASQNQKKEKQEQEKSQKQEKPKTEQADKEKGQQKKEETSQKPKEEKLPDSMDLLLEMNNPKANVKAKQIFKQMQEKNIQTVKDHNQQVSTLNQKIEYLNMSNQASQKKNKDLRQLAQTYKEDLNLTVKRLNKEKEDQKIFAISKFAKDILEVNDNLDRAIRDCKGKYDGKNHTLFEGVMMIRNVLQQIQGRHGIVPENPINQKFDPLVHESVFFVEDPTKENGTIIAVDSLGYRLKERVLRPAKVGIVQNKAKPAEQKAEPAEKKAEAADKKAEPAEKKGEAKPEETKNGGK